MGEPPFGFLLPVVAGVVLAGATSAAPIFSGLGGLGFPIPFLSAARAVSADGSTVVGVGVEAVPNQSDKSRAFRWTRSEGMRGIGELGGIAEDVSADGAVVVGRNTGRDGAFQWTESGGYRPLDLGPRSAAQAVSDDGAWIVGHAEPGSTGLDVDAFLWNADSGVVFLGNLPGGERVSGASDVSSDGSVVVGVGATALGFEAWRWDRVSGMQGLGVLPGGEHESQAFAVSADGRVVVGGSGGNLAPEAFRWSELQGMVGLGDPSRALRRPYGDPPVRTRSDRQRSQGIRSAEEEI